MTNLSGTLCGHLDPPLNEEGRLQAAALVPLLERRNICRLYASDLRRAIETAEVLTEAWRIPALARADLREISYGEWEGKRWSELKHSDVLRDIQSFEDSPDVRPPGGESFSIFRDRTERALRAIMADSRGSTVAVTHMGVIRVAIKYLSRPASHARVEGPIEHCGVYRFVFREGHFTFTGQLAAEP